MFFRSCCCERVKDKGKKKSKTGVGEKKQGLPLSRTHSSAGSKQREDSKAHVVSEALQSQHGLDSKKCELHLQRIQASINQRIQLQAMLTALPAWLSAIISGDFKCNVLKPKLKSLCISVTVKLQQDSKQCYQSITESMPPSKYYHHMTHAKNISSGVNLLLSRFLEASELPAELCELAKQTYIMIARYHDYIHAGESLLDEKASADACFEKLINIFEPLLALGSERQCREALRIICYLMIVDGTTMTGSKFQQLSYYIAKVEEDHLERKTKLAPAMSRARNGSLRLLSAACISLSFSDIHSSCIKAVMLKNVELSSELSQTEVIQQLLGISENGLSFLMKLIQGAQLFLEFNHETVESLSKEENWTELFNLWCSSIERDIIFARERNLRDYQKTAVVQHCDGLLPDELIDFSSWEKHLIDLRKILEFCKKIASDESQKESLIRGVIELGKLKLIILKEEHLLQRPQHKVLS